MLSGNAANVCLWGVGIQSHDLHLAPNNWGFAKLVKAQDFDSVYMCSNHISPAKLLCGNSTVEVAALTVNQLSERNRVVRLHLPTPN